MLVKIICRTVDPDISYILGPQTDVSQTTGQRSDCNPKNKGKVNNSSSKTLGAIIWVFTLILPPRIIITESGSIQARPCGIGDFSLHRPIDARASVDS